MTHLAFLGTFETTAPEWTRDDLDEPSYTRRGRHIPILTGTEQEAQSAVLDVRYRARKPIWTTTPPTAPGWWFVRSDDRSMGVPAYVQRFPDGTLRFSVLLQDWQPITMPGVVWGDMPITEPGSD